MSACPSQARSVVDSPGPAAEYRYAATHRPLCDEHRLRRYSALPTVMLLADRLASTVAPAMAAQLLGGMGVHTSSHTPTCSAKPSTLVAANTRSLPNGTTFPAMLTSPNHDSAARANQRRS